MTKEKENVEIFEYFDRTIPIYEIMLGEEYDKKMLGLKYSTLFTSEVIPFAEFGEPKDAKWVTLKKQMSFEEAKNKFGNF